MKIPQRAALALSLAVAAFSGFILKYDGAVAQKLAVVKEAPPRFTPRLVEPAAAEETQAPAGEGASACTPALKASAAPAGQIALTVTAPCRAGERVEIAHADLDFSDRLGADGILSVQLPAFLGIAVVAASFEDGAVATTMVRVPDADAYSRLMVMGEQSRALQIHARPGGAAYGDQGHVWRGTPGSHTETEPRGGYLTTLGDPDLSFPRTAEIHSILGADAGALLLSVEAEVTKQVCGEEIAAILVQSDASGPARVQHLTIDMPGCEALGEYVVLRVPAREVQTALR